MKVNLRIISMLLCLSIGMEAVQLPALAYEFIETQENVNIENNEPIQADEENGNLENDGEVEDLEDEDNPNNSEKLNNGNDAVGQDDTIVVDDNQDGQGDPTTEIDVGEAEEREEPFNGASVLGEVEDLREERTKYFLMSNGSFAAVDYGTDVHYKTEEGEWEEIDNSLTNDSDSTDGSGYANKEGRVRFKFAKNTNQKFLVKMQQGPTHLYMSLQAPQHNKGAKVSKSEKKTEYELK